jgi:hypothetical protein
MAWHNTARGGHVRFLEKLWEWAKTAVKLRGIKESFDVFKRWV